MEMSPLSFKVLPLLGLGFLLHSVVGLLPGAGGVWPSEPDHMTHKVIVIHRSPPLVTPEKYPHLTAFYTSYSPQGLSKIPAVEEN